MSDLGHIFRALRMSYGAGCSEGTQSRCLRCDTRETDRAAALPCPAADQNACRESSAPLRIAGLYSDDGRKGRTVRSLCALPRGHEGDHRSACGLMTWMNHGRRAPKVGDSRVVGRERDQ